MFGFFKVLQMVMAVLAGIAILIMMVLTFVDVVGRYGFNNSIFGTSEMIEFLMVIVVFAGVAFVSSGDQHIKVEIFEPFIVRFIPNLQRWVVLIFSLVIYAGLTYELGRVALDSFESAKRTPVLSFPQWFMPAGAAIFSILGVILFAIAIHLTRGHPAKLDRDFSDQPDETKEGI